MGLHYFTEEHTELFFGREALTAELIGRLETTHFLAIVGASGSGKSSLVRAGLVPAIRRQETSVCVITPTANPLQSLAKALANQGGTQDIEQVKIKLATNADTLYSAADHLVHQQNVHQLLLVVDQFEELFTGHSPEDERKMFIDNLMRAVSKEGPIKVIIVLRADFYARCANYKELRESLARNQEFVGSMSSAELRRAILEPARRGNWQFQDGLVDLILRDIGDEPGRLPLLAHAMRETWEQRRGRVMTLSGYAEVGRVDGAIAITAETVLNRFEDKQKPLVKNIFLNLTELSEGAEHTRRPATLDDLIFTPQDAILIEPVLQTLVDKRLVIIDKDKIEVAHEALIREWPSLQEWIKENQSALRIRRELSRAAKEWKDHNLDKSYLFQGARLTLVLERAEKQEFTLDSLSRDFLGASKQATLRNRVFTIGSLILATTLIAVISTLALTGQLPKLIFRPLPIEYIQIRAGEFRMGSTEEEIAFAKTLPNDLPAGAQYQLSNEQKAHTVYLDTFQISRYEITNKQYYQCVRATVCNPPSNEDYDHSEFTNFPVTDINWEDARNFCEWNGALLPTEAQWEKAARAAPNEDSRIYPWGNSLPPLQGDRKLANVVGRGKEGSLMAVGSFPDGKSAYGVADLAGNVWEWTRDWYADDYYEDPTSTLHNPPGPESGDTHTVRGGSFDNDWVQARTTYRSNKFRPGDTAFDLGFRCIIEESS